MQKGQSGFPFGSPCTMFSVRTRLRPRGRAWTHMPVKKCEDRESDTVKRMALDLETLKAEIQTYLEASDIPVFFGYHRTIDPMAHIAWDVENHPDFREFIGDRTESRREAHCVYPSGLFARSNRRSDGAVGSERSDARRKTQFRDPAKAITGLRRLHMHGGTIVHARDGSICFRVTHGLV